MTIKKAGLVLLAMLLGTCGQAIMVAPPNTDLTLFANPTFITAHGGISIISALLIDGTGNPVADGTVVQFFTNLGQIPEQGKTNDGVCRVNFVSDSRSGTATITAVSGGAPSVSPSTAPSPTGSVGSGIAGAFSVTGASAVSAVAAPSDTITVTIGSALPGRILISADPPRITSTNRTTTITARVFSTVETGSNPVANVPVFFTITSTGTGTERLGSGGGQLFTDSDGRVTDTLRTNALPETTPTTVQITATTVNGVPPGTVTVAIN